MQKLDCLFSRSFLLAILPFIIYSTTHSQTQYLYINEFMADNDNVIKDNFDEYDDWIEIYNANDYAVNLSGYYLTDNLSNPTKWAFPDVSIAAKGFLLIWTDDDTEQGELHTSFKLSADGEQVGFYDGSNFVDSLTYSQQTTDISYGRYPDGDIDWYSFSDPSPDAPNNDSIIEYAEAPTFSPQGGFYNGSVTVELSVSSPTATIRYTLDCYEPTEQSLLYTEPIVVALTTVIRARTFEQGNYPSEIITHSYVVDMDFDIATLSMVTNPPNLWNADSGIYVNYEERGDDWERPVSLEFYKENNDLGFAENAGMRIHGGGSRRYDKKSFRLYFRSEYGQSWLHYPLFGAKNHIDEFKRLIVHAGSTDMPASEEAADGWTLLRGPLMHEFCHKIDDGIYTANYPVAVYLNAEPWGIYYLFERPDKYYTYSNFGELDVDIIEDGRGARVGDMDAWYDMINFFKENDISLDSNYETAKTYVDIDTYTDYNVVQIFGSNRDWPDNNYLAFRPRKEQALWRWIIWDLDQCFVPFGLNFNTLEFATNEQVENTEILISLLDNENYKNLFINRFADLLNTIFLASSSIHLIDSLADVIRNDLTYETDKWGSSPEEWEQQGIVDELYDFANKRPDIVRDHIEEKFSLSGHTTLTLETPQGGQGRIKVNSIHTRDYPWKGIYFKEIPISLISIPDPGYLFLGWSDSSLAQTEEINITLYNDYSIHAIFTPDNQTDTLVITEINYNSSVDFNPEDWIELYNPSDHVVDVSYWHLKDDDNAHDFVFPAGTTVDPHGYLIVCFDQVLFHSQFPDVSNYIGDLGFGLSGGGDQVRLFSASSRLIDSVAYDDDPPWAIEADGTGATLELLDPELDNTLPENWQASIPHGSPGEATTVLHPSKYTISGSVRYANTGRPVSEVLINLTSPQGTESDTTDQTDSYIFSDIAADSITLAPDKQGDIRDAIKGSDVLLVLQYLAFLVNMNNDEQFAADVTEDGRITGSDALAMLRYLAFYADNIGSTGQWRFKPDDSTFVLESDTTIDFQAYLLGDANLDWGSGGRLAKNSEFSPISSVSLGIDSACVLGERSIEIPIIIKATDQEINTLVFSLEYDSVYLAFRSISKTNLSDDFLVVANGTESGKIHIAIAGINGINHKGQVLRLNFQLKDQSVRNQTTEFIFSRMLINDQKVTDFTSGKLIVNESNSASQPQNFSLSQNYPNPFNSETQIFYQLPATTEVRVTIYNLIGKLITTLVNTKQSAGTYQIHWNGKDNHGATMPSGIYIVELHASGFTRCKKMIMMK